MINYFCKWVLVLCVAASFIVNNKTDGSFKTSSWESREAVFWTWMYDRFRLEHSKDEESEAWRNFTGTDYDSYELITIVYRIVEEEFDSPEIIPLVGKFPYGKDRKGLSRTMLREPASGRGAMRIVDASVRCKDELRNDELQVKLVAKFSQDGKVHVIHRSLFATDWTNEDASQQKTAR